MSLKVHFRQILSSFCEEDQSLASLIFLLPWSGRWREQPSISSLLRLHQKAALSLPWSCEREEVCYLRMKVVRGEGCSLESYFSTRREVSRHQLSLNRYKCILFYWLVPQRISVVSLFNINKLMDCGASERLALGNRICSASCSGGWTSWTRGTCINIWFASYCVACLTMKNCWIMELFIY